MTDAIDDVLTPGQRGSRFNAADEDVNTLREGKKFATVFCITDHGVDR
jgi:hypothetical protein